MHWLTNKVALSSVVSLGAGKKASAVSSQSSISEHQNDAAIDNATSAMNGLSVGNPGEEVDVVYLVSLSISLDPRRAALTCRYGSFHENSLV